MMFGTTSPAAALFAAMVIMLSTPGPSCDDGWEDPPRPDENALGHFGPGWGHADGSDVIVFRWDGDHDPADDYIDRRRNAETRGSIYAVKADGSGLSLLSPSAGDGRELGDRRLAYDTAPAVSPDGNRIAYATLRHSEPGGNYDITVAGIDGSERSELARTRESQSEPSWSPDGTRIAFVQDRYLHTMAADGSDVRSIVPDIPVMWEPPSWSPDGSRLAFRAAAWRDAPASLYVVNADGSRLTKVAEAGNRAWPAGAWRPVWSPDGRSVAFVTIGLHHRVVKRPGLSVVDVVSGEVTTLVWGGFGPFVWSPDGTEIFYGSTATWSDDEEVSESGLFAVAANDDGEGRRVTAPENSVLGLAWSRDGTRLAVRAQSFRTDRYPLTRYADIVAYTVAPDGSDMRVLAREGSDGTLVAAVSGPVSGHAANPLASLAIPPVAFVWAAAAVLFGVIAYALPRAGRRRQN